jgi:hypothetical protein
MADEKKYDEWLVEVFDLKGNSWKYRNKPEKNYLVRR